MRNDARRRGAAGEAAAENAATVGAKPMGAVGGMGGEVQFGVAHVKPAGNAVELRRRLQASAASAA